MSFLLVSFLCILFYPIFLLLYLQNKISGSSFILFFLLSLIILTTVHILKRKKVYKRKISYAVCILFILFCYELPLIFYDATTHVALLYQPPEEIIEGTNIYLLGVNSVEFSLTKNKLDVSKILERQHVKPLAIVEGDNKDRYASKNRQLLSWLHLKEDTTEQMKKNVSYYLEQTDQKTEKKIDAFLNRERIGGDSGGLALVLSGKVKNEGLQNEHPIAITGAIDKNGNVKTIGMLKEKIQIASISGISYLIIPSGNKEEANKFRKEINSNIQIFDVATIDEAIEVIEKINQK